MRIQRHPLEVTLVTTFRRLDPRRSLVAGISWLVIALASCFAVAASLWVGSLARDNIVRQHARRLALETDQLASDVAQAIAARRNAVAAAAALFGRGNDADPDAARRTLFAGLQRDHPELGWIGMTDPDGRVVVGAPAERPPPWFGGGRHGLWLGAIPEGVAADRFEPLATAQPVLGALALPATDAGEHPVGVVAAKLSWRRNGAHQRLLGESGDASLAAQALLIDGQGTVVAGPADWRGRQWDGSPVPDQPLLPAGPRFEGLPDGRVLLVARAPVEVTGTGSNNRWQVQLIEPKDRVYVRADALGLQILWVSIGLGALTAMLGALGARRLTRRLARLTASAMAVRGRSAEHIEVPPGHDEVTTLAAAFATVLEDLRRERADLRALGSELERRVAARTREVERLAAESRYAAVVRERLKIARDLHDTLAHSMMAMLSEIRLLRRLQVQDPGALAAELARAEEVAQSGLNEARSAITQVRADTVRDIGLGPALRRLFERFVDHTAIAGEFTADAAAANVGDERAETLLRIAAEALRNVERHARATHFEVVLRIEGGTHLELSIRDNGIGFDPQRVPPGHFGLVGLREQAQLIDADLDVVSVINVGTTVKLRLRVSPEAL